MNLNIKININMIIWLEFIERLFKRFENIITEKLSVVNEHGLSFIYFFDDLSLKICLLRIYNVFYQFENNF